MAENSRCLTVAGGRWENLIPECNDLVFGFWQRAAIGCTARATSGTLCPAPREDACVLSITTDPVPTKDIELRITDPDTAGSPRSGHR